MGLSIVIQTLQESHTANSQVQSEIYNRLPYLQSLPDFNNYLLYVLAFTPGVTESVRAAAGLLLKKNVMYYYDRFPIEVQNYVKAHVLNCVGDEAVLIRATVAVIVTAIAQKGGLNNWPNLIPSLVHLLDSSHADTVEGALNCLSKLCEDMPTRIDSVERGNPLEVLVPKWLSFFPCPVAKIRLFSLNCLVQFILHRSNALMANAENFVNGLYSLAMDEYIPVRRLVCEGLVNMLEVRPDLLLVQMTKIVEYMLLCSSDSDELLALEACEFWSSFCDAEIAKDTVRPYLPALIPVLLKNMIFSEFELIHLEAGRDDNADEPDAQSSIEPRFHHAKAKGNQYESDDPNGSSDWNLRKSAAAALDLLAGVYEAELLGHILPVIESGLNSSQWTEREASILALGAISGGCQDGLSDHLPNLIQHLVVTALNDHKPLVRKITCWTLARYSEWVVAIQPTNGAQNPEAQAILVRLMEGLLNRVLDRNKAVQETACSAFASLEEHACVILCPYIGGILEVFTNALGLYQVRNLRVLYDAIGTLATGVGTELGNPTFLNVIMGPLVEKWLTLGPHDVVLNALMECLTSIANAVKDGFTPFAPRVFSHASQLCQVIIAAHLPNSDYQGEPPDKDLLVCALDLVSGVTEAIGPSVESLVPQTNILEVLQYSMMDPMPEVRQCAFAVLGDLVKTCIGHILPYLGAYFPILTDNLNPVHVSACNNCGWAIGEIALKVGDQIAPYVPGIVVPLVNIMNIPNVNRNLLENTAIAIGRIGYVCPHLVAPYLSQFVHNWCFSLRYIRDDIEKESAFAGLCAMIEINPQGVADEFMLVCDAIASWRRPPPALHQHFGTILYSFRNALDEQSWQAYYQNFPYKLREILHRQYNLGL